MDRVIKQFIRGISSAALLAGSSTAFGYGIGVIAPINDAGEGRSESISTPGLLELNPERDAFTTTKGLSTVAAVSVDNTDGVIRGFASASLPAATTFIVGTDAIGTSAAGVLSILSTDLLGDDSAPTTLTFEMEFDGSFVTTSGMPSFELFGDLTITTIDTSGLLPTGTIYQSLLQFSSSVATAGIVTTQVSGIESPLLGGPSTPFSGAFAEILSTDAATLHGRVGMTVPVTAGLQLVFSAVIAGAVSPEIDPSDTDFEDGVDLLASAGAVDFSHTATVRILLPEGYALENTDPLLAGIVETTPVPIPPSAVMLLSALLPLSWLKARSRREAR